MAYSHSTHYPTGIFQGDFVLGAPGFAGVDVFLAGQKHKVSKVIIANNNAFDVAVLAIFDAGAVSTAAYYISAFSNRTFRGFEVQDGLAFLAGAAAAPNTHVTVLYFNG